MLRAAARQPEQSLRPTYGTREYITNVSNTTEFCFFIFIKTSPQTFTSFACPGSLTLQPSDRWFHSSEHSWRRRNERSKRSHHRRSPTSHRRRRHHRDESSPRSPPEQVSPTFPLHFIMWMNECMIMSEEPIARHIYLLSRCPPENHYFCFMNNV